MRAQLYRLRPNCSAVAGVPPPSAPPPDRICSRNLFRRRSRQIIEHRPLRHARNAYPAMPLRRRRTAGRESNPWRTHARAASRRMCRDMPIAQIPVSLETTKAPEGSGDRESVPTVRSTACQSSSAAPEPNWVHRRTLRGTGSCLTPFACAQDVTSSTFTEAMRRKIPGNVADSLCTDGIDHDHSMDRCQRTSIISSLFSSGHRAQC